MSNKIQHYRDWEAKIESLEAANDSAMQALAEKDKEIERLKKIAMLVQALMPPSDDPQLVGHVVFRKALWLAVNGLEWEDQEQHGMKAMQTRITDLESQLADANETIRQQNEQIGHKAGEILRANRELAAAKAEIADCFQLLNQSGRNRISTPFLCTAIADVLDQLAAALQRAETAEKRIASLAQVYVRFQHLDALFAAIEDGADPFHMAARDMWRAVKEAQFAE